MQQYQQQILVPASVVAALLLLPLIRVSREFSLRSLAVIRFAWMDSVFIAFFSFSFCLPVFGHKK